MQNLSGSTNKLFEKVLQISRVSKSITGGKKSTFRAVVAVGDKRSKIGIGIGKSADQSRAVEKARLNARKTLTDLKLQYPTHVNYIIKVKNGASVLLVKPANEKARVLAGDIPRSIFELAGVQSASIKQYKSQNILNIARASINALKQLSWGASQESLHNLYSGQ